IEAAVSARDPLYGAGTPSEGTYRAVFGEADGLPGLILDRFQGAWVMEPHSYGMSVRREEIVEALVGISRDRFGDSSPNIFYRTDHRMASLEGIEPVSEILRGEAPAQGVWAVEDGIRFPVDPLKGQ